MKRSLATAVTSGLFLLTACGGGQSLPSSDATSTSTTEVVATTIPPTAGAAGQPSPNQEPAQAGRVARLPRSPLLEQIQELPAAGGIPEPTATVRPVSISYSSIGVANAAIEAVGVEDNGEMEIPGASTVGWYQFGPSPGQPGSAVLAAHIAFDGERGVFRDLADSQEDDTFTVSFDDGSAVQYLVVERAQYDKDQLPFDRIFSKDGPPIITLISCGGAFQQSLSSYQDNIVAYAVPLM